eukprot:TRINITY_DN3022_c0_g1_i2.p1 TRINITY_DN3022_c0_g1~~TRINITY_DN3022_c0_g1_i2.p1  ORF type:complete len:622 (-),score=118.04 TRINITY_DN3022_c0_g1_i2:274-2139(-)
MCTTRERYHSSLCPALILQSASHSLRLQLKQFSPEQLKEMGAGMENSDDLRRNAAILEQQTAARQQYELKAAQKLKAEGNQLVSSGKHGDASQKYLKAKSNLEGHESAEARTLKTSCSLNLLICYLRTGQNEEAVREGSEVLRTDSSNLKALYRRGQAYRALGKLQLALTDLRKASQIDPDDETVRSAAQEVKEALAKQRSESSEPGSRSEESPVAEPAKRAATASPTGAGTSGAPPSIPPGFSPDSETVKRSLEMMKQMDPETLKNMHKMMADMSPEVIASMTPGITPEMARQTQEQLKSLSPEDFQRQAELASHMAKMQGTAGTASHSSPSPPAAGAATPSKPPAEVASGSGTKAADPAKKVIRIDHQRKPGSTKSNGKAKVEDGAVESDDEVEEIRTTGAARAEPPAAPPPSFQRPPMTPEMLASVQDRFKDPAAMKAMGDMMSSMSPETMAAMSASMGMSITPEMAKMAMESMKNVKPEDMHRMTEAVGANGGASTSGSPFAGMDPSSMDDMKEKLKDPQMMKMAAEMMKNLSPEMLQSMGAQAGLKMTPEQAEKAAEAMKGLSEKDIQTMMVWADRMQRVGTTARAARDWLLARPLIILAIVVLFVAVLLRWLGYV